MPLIRRVSSPPDMGLRRALVTGGSGVIGQAIAQTLARQGLEVLVHAHRHPEPAQDLVSQIQREGGNASVLVFDVTDPQACNLVLGKALQQGPIQVVINNAGMHDDAAFPSMRGEQWQSVVDANLNSFFHVTHGLMMPMLQSRWGRVVAISSVAAQAGNRGQVNYAAAKAGLHGAVKSLALEVASRGITVNAVAPGIIASSMSLEVFSEESVRRMVPMQRPGQAQEVADLVAFLVSEKASYISGQIIGINGAMYC